MQSQLLKHQSSSKTMLYNIVFVDVVQQTFAQQYLDRHGIGNEIHYYPCYSRQQTRTTRKTWRWLKDLRLRRTSTPSDLATSEQKYFVILAVVGTPELLLRPAIAGTLTDIPTLGHHVPRTAAIQICACASNLIFWGVRSNPSNPPWLRAWVVRRCQQV